MSRADIFLFENGYAKSRQAAQNLINDGRVLYNGKAIDKPSKQIPDGAELTIISDKYEFVSRGGVKLECAVSAFNVCVEGLVCADIGASTGGFTDCLLYHGASKVYAIEGGCGQLDKKLQTDARVVNMEKTNARYIDGTTLPQMCDLVVMDVSFISQTLIYSSVSKILKPGGIFISLIKPQFEVGREKLGKHGIADEKYHGEVIEKIKSSADSYNLIYQNIIKSPITGGDGNVEYLIMFVKGHVD